MLALATEKLYKLCVVYRVFGPDTTHHQIYFCALHFEPVFPQANQSLSKRNVANIFVVKIPKRS